MNKQNTFKDARNYNALLLVKSAKNKLKNKNYMGALKDANKAIELNNKLSSAYFIRGEIYSSIDQYTQMAKLEIYENSLKNYNEAIKYDTNSYESFEGRGKLYFKKKKYDSAKSDFSKAIILTYSSELILNPDPLNPLPLIRLSLFDKRGRAHYHLSQFKNAIMDFNKVLELSKLAVPNAFFDSYYFDKRGFYEMRGKANLMCGFFEDSIKDFSFLLANNETLINFDECILYMLRAKAYTFIDNYELALDDILKVIPHSEKCQEEIKGYLIDFPDEFKGILKISLPQKYLDNLI